MQNEGNGGNGGNGLKIQENIVFQTSEEFFGQNLWDFQKCPLWIKVFGEPFNEPWYLVVNGLYLRNSGSLLRSIFYANNVHVHVLKAQVIDYDIECVNENSQVY